MATAEKYQFSGARIRELRLKRGLTMEELAADVGKHRSTLWAYEKDRQWPPADTLADIAHYLRVVPGAFFVKDRPVTRDEFDALPLMLRVEDVMRLADLGRSSVYEACRHREISSVRIGRSLRIPKNRLADLLGLDDA